MAGLQVDLAPAAAVLTVGVLVLVALRVTMVLADRRKRKRTEEFLAALPPADAGPPDA